MLKAARSALPVWEATQRRAATQGRPYGVTLNGRLRKLGRFLELGSLDKFVLFNACDVLPVDLSAVGMQPTGRFPYREQVLAEAK